MKGFKSENLGENYSEDFMERFSGTFGKENPLNDSEYMKKVREEFAERLEDLITDPSLGDMEWSMDMPSNVRSGGKAEWSTLARDALARLGQDLRLSPEDRDRLRSLLLEDKPVN